MLRLLLFLPLACAELADFDLGATIKGIPGAVRSNFRQFRVGTKQMWTNGKAAGAVKKRLKAGGDPLSYSEFHLLRKSSEDTGKLIQAGVLWIVAPELIPVMLYFFPRALPSTFESDQGAQKRYATLCRARATATLSLLTKLEEDSVGEGRKAKRTAAQRLLAIQMLKTKSIADAAAPMQPFLFPSTPPPKRQGKARALAAIKPLPQPLLKTGCKLIGLSGPIPGPIRRSSLANHLAQLVEEDAILRRTQLSTLSRSELVDACLDRGIGSLESTDAQLQRHLSTWLQLVHPQQTTDAPDPHRLRLAMMAASAITATRSAPEMALPRLLFTG
ncbi:hypothetical protein AB1Y20_000829 [Prymnesium parvum]|uniref:Letm1 RBD domain-containing protein n=1 Tax=Prymnesium parvum TaxID=97485 RepID=A0AB34KA93_PRYPA